MRRHRLLPRALPLGFAIAVSLIVAWPLISEPGLLNTRGGGDSPFLLQRLQQLTTAVADGHFPVRWMPDAAYGLGYPFYNYYAPLSIYIAALFRLVGFSYVRAIQLAQVAGFITAAVASFHLGRRWLKNDWGGVLTSVAYSTAPFHMVNVYVRGDSLAEFWAMALYPVVLLAADHLDVAAPPGVRRRQLAWLALAYGALIVTHNISALIFSPFLGLFLLLKAARSRRVARSLALMAGALGLGLGVAAWFFLPALAEQNLVQLDEVTNGYFHFSNHFRGRDLVQGSLLFDYNVADGQAFRMGLVQALLAIAGLTLWLWPFKRSKPPPLRWFLLLVLALATFMILPLSGGLWARLPLLPFTQFPWRFLSVQALGTALATAGVARLPSPWRSIGGSLVVAALLATALGGLETVHLPLTDADVTPERLAQYEWFTGNIGTTVSAEYLPASVGVRPYSSGWLVDGQRPQATTISGEATAVRQASSTTHQIWVVDVQGAEPAVVQFPTFFWPGWRAAIDGRTTTITPGTGAGLITVAVPPGSHDVDIRLSRTPIRLAAEIVSLLAIALAVWWGRPVGTAWRRPTGLAVGIIAVTSVALRLWPTTPALPETNLNWDFAQMGYLSHSALVFDDGAELTRYAYSASTVRAGETLTIDVAWTGGGGRVAGLRLLTPATHRYPLTPTAAFDEQPLSENGRYTLAIPAETPPGFYVPRLERDSLALDPLGQPRGDIFLRPVLVTAVDNATAAGDDLTVEATAATIRPDGHLAVNVRWYTPHPLMANYQVALRVVDRWGQNEACPGLNFCQIDVPTGYGFQPSISWPAHVWRNDAYVVPLPASLAGEAPFGIVLTLYEAGSRTVILERRLGQLTPTESGLSWSTAGPAFSLPTTAIRVNLTLAAAEGDAIRLLGYSPPALSDDSEWLSLTLYWAAVSPARGNYQRFLHLVADGAADIVTQSDGAPLNNSFPSSQWLPDAVVADPIRLAVAELPPGRYTLLTGLYRPDGTRLTAADLVDGRVLLTPIELPRR